MKSFLACLLLSVVSTSAFAHSAAFEVKVGDAREVVLPLEIKSVKSSKPSVVKVRRLSNHRLALTGMRKGSATLVMKTRAGNRAEVDIAVMAPSRGSTFVARR